MTRSRFRRAIICAAIGTGLYFTSLTPALTEEQYPNRPIKLVVPFPAGGTPDTVARIVADKLLRRWNKPVVVENRPGATGNIGAEAVAKAEPDGHTLLVAPPPPLVVNQHLFDNLRFDPATFVPITVVASAPNVLLARPGLAVDSVQDLVALAKSQPSKLTYGSTGKGSSMHLAAEMLRFLAAIDIVHVAYKSIPQYLNDMVGGSIDVGFANLVEALPLVEGGRLKVLAVASAERSPLLSNVPALAETMPGFVSTTWFAVVAPPNTRPQIAAKLSSAIAETLGHADSRARFESLKATPILNSPSEAAAFFNEERERWRRIIVAAGVKPQ